MNKLLFAAIAAASFAGAAQAATFTFDAQAAGGSQLNATPTGFTLLSGTVDIVKSGEHSITCAGGTGGCLDLNGSTGQGGVVLANDAFLVNAGTLYSFGLDISGNQRNGASDRFSFVLDFSPDTNLNDVQLFVNNVSVFGPVNGVSTNPGSGQVDIAGNMPWTNARVQFRSNVNTSFTLRLGTSSTDTDSIGPLIDNISFGAVPEPGTWAMMLAGFGVVGAALRRRPGVRGLRQAV